MPVAPWSPCAPETVPRRFEPSSTDTARRDENRQLRRRRLYRYSTYSACYHRGVTRSGAAGANGATPTPLQAFCATLTDNVEKVIVGKRDVIDLVLVALLVEAHVLFGDVPGTGKTMLARAVAASLGGSFKRIQFTPDLLPNDVTGVSIYNQRTQEFEFRPGPIFANVMLADEINRATPRTQSALLELSLIHI